MLHELGGPEPAVAAFSRGPRQFRCASLVCLPGQDWIFSIIRQFLYDVQENVRLTALSQSTLAPLARLARDLLPVEKRHLAQGRSWILRLGGSMGEKRRRMQDSLAFAYPHALGLFEPTEADEPLAQSGICPSEEQLRHEWESALVPVLEGAGLSIPDNARPVHGGRVGQHLPTFPHTLADLRRAHESDPSGQW
jgi:ring-1,2-phenylacetyl-CoA epoxidase subunit PaaC